MNYVKIFLVEHVFINKTRHIISIFFHNKPKNISNKLKKNSVIFQSCRATESIRETNNGTHR